MYDGPLPGDADEGENEDERRRRWANLFLAVVMTARETLGGIRDRIQALQDGYLDQPLSPKLQDRLDHARDLLVNYGVFNWDVNNWGISEHERQIHFGNDGPDVGERHEQILRFPQLAGSSFWLVEASSAADDYEVLVSMWRWYKNHVRIRPLEERQDADGRQFRRHGYQFADPAMVEPIW